MPEMIVQDDDTTFVKEAKREATMVMLHSKAELWVRVAFEQQPDYIN